MKKTIREEVILELVARGAVIRTNGSPQAYSTDCGQNVLRSRPKVGDEELPCVVVWPQIETCENANGLSKHEMPVQIDSIMAFGSRDPQEVGEEMYGDLIKCFASPSWDRTRPGSPCPGENFFDSIVHQSGGAAAPEDGSVTVGATARFIITYWTQVGDPYNQ